MYQPKTGQRCSCKRGVPRDNCPNCEGTGMVVDFAAIRARSAARVAEHAAKTGTADREATERLVDAIESWGKKDLEE